MKDYVLDLNERYEPITHPYRLNGRQAVVLARIEDNPGCARNEAIDSFFTANGWPSVANAYARVKTLENAGLLYDQSERMNRSELHLTQYGRAALEAYRDRD